MAKGGEQKTEIKIPEELKQAAVKNLGTAQQVGQIGYMPYRGPDVAAFSPLEQAAAGQTRDAAGAFGMGGSTIGLAAGMPPVVSQGGVSGYSAAPNYDAAVSQIPKGQLEALMKLFIDPQTGEMAESPDAPTGATQNLFKPTRRQWDWTLNDGRGGYYYPPVRVSVGSGN